MDKVQLEARLAKLQNDLKQVEANGNALIGAIAECQYWLGIATAAEAEQVNPNDTRRE